MAPAALSDLDGIGGDGVTAAGSSQRSNALATRISSVLSTAYSDLEIRDALETLDARNIDNSHDTRRRLRLDVQKEVIQCNGQIVQDFGNVAQQLKQIGTVISSLNGICADLRKSITASKSETAPVLEEASSLVQQKDAAETKQHLLNAFSSHFILSDTDTVHLTSTAEPVNDEFFQLLTRVKKIHKDCQVLLGTENQRLGLEILEESSKSLNAAYQKLYRWIQREFKTLDLENPQITASVRRQLRVLAEKPALFQNCLDLFAEAREQSLSDSFYVALTGSHTERDGRPVSKPIEFQAHDPLRYVGDMLAWAHSAAVSEREALEGLFISEGDEIARSIQAGLESEPWLRPEEAQVFDGRIALDQLVNRDLAGVARLLRQRTEQVIHSHDDAPLAYQTANLLGFYGSMFARLIGEESTLLDVLHDLENSAMRQFKARMRDHIATIQGEVAMPGANLAPPNFLEEALEMLQDLMKSFETSIAGSDEPEGGFEPIFADVLDPFLKRCEGITKSMDPPDGDIFAINCALSTRSMLEPFKFTASRLATLEEMVERHEGSIVEYQHDFFLRSSGLDTLHSALSRLPETEEALKSIPTLPECQPDRLYDTSQTLDDFLPSASMDAAENLKHLRDRTMAERINEQAAEAFCQGFELVEDRLEAADEVNQDESDTVLREVFPRTSAEIRVLLS